MSNPLEIWSIEIYVFNFDAFMFGVQVAGIVWNQPQRMVPIIDVDVSTEIWPHLMWNIGENETG